HAAFAAAGHSVVGPGSSRPAEVKTPPGPPGAAQASPTRPRLKPAPRSIRSGRALFVGPGLSRLAEVQAHTAGRSIADGRLRSNPRLRHSPLLCFDSRL